MHHNGIVKSVFNMFIWSAYVPMHELQAVPSPNAVAKKYSNSLISFSVKPTSLPPPQHISLDTFRSIGCLHFPLCVRFAQHVPAATVKVRKKDEQKDTKKTK